MASPVILFIPKLNPSAFIRLTIWPTSREMFVNNLSVL
jgi:hypothetical protein